MSDAEAKMRLAIWQSTAGLVPEQFRDEVVDLAIHACRSAFVAVGDVTGRATDSRVMLSAMGIALGLIAAEAPLKVEALEKTASAAGMTTTLRQVSL